MIRLPSLDDQRYSDIVEAAKRRIPVIFPEWTDFNEHDPGITMIELFAWLKEMQQYYLDRFSERSYESMLRLLGIEMGQPTPAEAEIRFFPDEVPAHVIKGAEARTDDGTVFVSETPFCRSPLKLGDVYLEIDGELQNVTDVARDAGTGFFPFGSQRNAGQRSLILCADVVGDMTGGAALYFDISDKYPVARNPASPGCRAPRVLRWEYSTPDGFRLCPQVIDETLALSFTGSVTLTVGEDFAPTTLGGRIPAAACLRVCLEDSGCEDMPSISCIYNNRLKLRQTTRLSDFAEFTVSGGEVRCSDKLLHDGLGYVLVRDDRGWRYDENAVIRREGRETAIHISGGVTPSRDGAPNLRVVFAEEHFGRTKMFFTSDGLPGQSFDFHLDDEPLCGSLRVMAAEDDGMGGTIWQDFTYVDHLALAGPYDRAFTYNRADRTLDFGDNENGEVPARGDDRIMVIACACTAGSVGNIRRGNLRLLSDVDGEYAVTQQLDAAGGSDREPLERAMDRLKLRMSECVRAVTAEDYRTLALKTPGLRVADVKAIPMFDPEVQTASRDKLANTITLAVLPYSTDKFPLPDESFLAAIREHIENYRMITTNVKVAAPIYVSVDISAEVVCSIREVEEVRRRVISRIRDMFAVIGSAGTRFGEPVSEVDVMTGICGVEGILTARRLQLGVSDSRCYRDSYGRIIIPPHAIAYPGRITIEVTEP